MNQRDNFTTGFLLGAVVGGITGSIVGALLAAKRLEEIEPLESQTNGSTTEAKPSRSKTRSLKQSEEEKLEFARRSLEDKIAQLNETIDEVRQQLGTVNRTPKDPGERPRPIP